MAILSIRRQMPPIALAASYEYNPTVNPEVENHYIKSEIKERLPGEEIPASILSQSKDDPEWEIVVDNFAQKYGFTKRETQVLELTLHDLTVVKMAETLNVSEPTVKHYIRQMLRKTETKNRRELLSMLIKEQADKHY